MQKYISMKGGSATHRIEIAAILFVVVRNRDCQVVTRYQTYTLRTSLMALLDELPTEDFFQVHRTIVVNMKHITGLSRENVFIHEHCLPVGRSHYDELRGIFIDSFNEQQEKLPSKSRSGSIGKVKRVKADGKSG
ncbi:LytR/AlgR family response regulator transcription factor [Flavihumibacter solisilvae]|uniref:HTH LytTR-type domain-containing protein n=1 Tax=Flavihumibacter solisilvae TaxID=1349421 RepID=A0A0C1ID76_9BACT|nr:LytTR family DNA-binding domain-containing protein [Flavihumibacter solisilvae]KIC91995.1 hypothetical protein OI18_21980 [Flavihumibacter solisilvae]